MTMEQMIGLSLALLIMAVGLIGSLIPALPSTPFILVGAVGHRLYFGEFSASNTVLILLVAITLLSLALDYLASMFGAKKMGATWRGVLGAIVGAMVGIFFSLPGILLGPFIGALLFELAGQREFHHAVRAGVGATLGILLGAVAKLACCVAMIALFAVSVISRSSPSPTLELEAPLAFIGNGWGFLL